MNIVTRRRFNVGSWLIGIASLGLALFLGLFVVVLGLRTGIAAVFVGGGLLAVGLYALLLGLCMMGNKTALAFYTGAFVFLTDMSLRAGVSAGLDAQSMAKLAMCGGALLIALSHLRVLKQQLWNAKSLLLLFYALVAMLSALWSAIPAYSFGAAAALLSVTLYAATITAILDKVQLIRCVLYGLVIFLLLSLARIAVVMIGFDAGLEFRYAGFAGSANNLGRLGALGAIFAGLYFVYSKRHGGVSVLWAVLGVAGLIASNSRTSAAVMIAGLWALLKRKYRFITAAIILVATPLLIASSYYGLFQTDTVAGHISRTGYAEDAMTLTGRVHIWAYLVDKIEQAPVLGHGYAATRDFMPNEWSTRYGWTTTSAHNSVLQSLVTVGLVGTVPLLLIWLLQLLDFLRRPSPLRDAIFMVVIVNGLTESGVIGGVPSVITFLWAISIYWKEPIPELAEAAPSKWGGLRAGPSMNLGMPLRR